MEFYKEPVGKDRYYYIFTDAKIKQSWSDFTGERRSDSYGTPDRLFVIDFTDEDEIFDALSEEGVVPVSIYVPKNNTDPQTKPVKKLTVKMIYREGEKWDFLRPTVRLISTTNGVETPITEETLDCLKNAIITKANVTLRMHNWVNMGKPGVTAQLVDGEFYSSGSSEFVPPYRQKETTSQPAVEPYQNADDDLPF